MAIQQYMLLRPSVHNMLTTRGAKRSNTAVHERPGFSFLIFFVIYTLFNMHNPSRGSGVYEYYKSKVLNLNFVPDTAKQQNNLRHEVRREKHRQSLAPGHRARHMSCSKEKTKWKKYNERAIPDT